MKKFQGTADFELTWLPHLLMPNAARAGSDKDPQGVGAVGKLDDYRKRLGEDGAQQMVARMKQAAGEVGISISYAGRTGGSFDSHRLITLARKQGGGRLVDELVEELFRNYFEQDKYVGSPTVLQAAADKVGLKVDVAKFLASDAEVQETHADMGGAKQNLKFAGAVPYFKVQAGADEVEFGGAQPTEYFEQLFDWFTARSREAGAAAAKL